jgi:hypothetical protein
MSSTGSRDPCNFSLANDLLNGIYSLSSSKNIILSVAQSVDFLAGIAGSDNGVWIHQWGDLCPLATVS